MGSKKAKGDKITVKGDKINLKIKSPYDIVIFEVIL